MQEVAPREKKTLRDVWPGNILQCDLSEARLGTSQVPVPSPLRSRSTWSNNYTHSQQTVLEYSCTLALVHQEPQFLLGCMSAICGEVAPEI